MKLSLLEKHSWFRKLKRTFCPLIIYYPPAPKTLYSLKLLWIFSKVNVACMRSYREDALWAVLMRRQNTATAMMTETKTSDMKLTMRMRWTVESRSASATTSSEQCGHDRSTWIRTVQLIVQLTSLAVTSSLTVSVFDYNNDIAFQSKADPPTRYALRTTQVLCHYAVCL